MAKNRKFKSIVDPDLIDKLGEATQTVGDPYFVATPLSEDPLILTFTYEKNPMSILPISGMDTSRIVPRPLDITMKVKTFNMQGEALGGVEFHWHCRVMEHFIPI